MKLLGIDYGDKRIGLSIAEINIAVPFKAVISKTMKENIDTISEIISDEKIEKIVIGLPLNMDGTLGLRAKKTKAFGKVLEKVSEIKVVYQDERLTSFDAKEKLSDINLKKSNRKNKTLTDILSAQLILQEYLNK